MTPKTATFDPAAESAELARCFYKLSQAVDEFRITNWDMIEFGERGRLKDEAQALDNRAHHFTAEAIGITLESIKTDLEAIKSATADAQKAVSVLGNVSKVMSIATTAVAMGSAIASGDVQSILASGRALAKAVAG